MTPGVFFGIVAALAASAAAAGLVLVVAAVLRPHLLAPRRRPSRVRTKRRRSGEQRRRDRVWALGGAFAGVVLWAASGWAVAIVVLPAAAIVLPRLLRPPDTRRVISRLEAMEDWTRNLSGVLTAGVGLEQAIISSERAVPDAIKPEVSLLVSRLRVHWDTEQALRRFADDLNDATGDRLATSLIASSKSSGTDLAAVLERIAASVSDEVRMRRQIEADRGKPRSSARIITIVSLIGVLVIAASTGGYGRPYLEPAGQVWALIWLGLGLGCLLWMRQIGASRRIARFLGQTAPRQGVAE